MSSGSLSPKDTIVPEEQTNQLRQLDLDEDSIHYNQQEDEIVPLEDNLLVCFHPGIWPKEYSKRQTIKSQTLKASQIGARLLRELTSVTNEKEDSEDEADSFPEGGAKAWIVTFGCFMGLVACFGLLNSTGVMESHLQDNQLAKESVSTIGWLFSLFLFVCFASCIISGTYFDRNGFRTIMIIGTVFHVAGLFATANSTKYWHFILSFAIVCGFGNGIVLSPLVSVPAHYFFKRRGTALAVATIRW